MSALFGSASKRLYRQSRHRFRFASLGQPQRFLTLCFSSRLASLPFPRRPFLPSHPLLYLLSVLSTLALPHRFLVSRSSLIPLAVCAACCRIVLKVTDGAIRLNQQSPNQLIGFLVSRLSVLGCLVLLRFESMEGWSRDLILQFRTTDTRKLNSCFLAGTTSLGRLTPSVLTLHL